MSKPDTFVVSATIPEVFVNSIFGENDKGERVYIGGTALPHLAHKAHVNELGKPVEIHFETELQSNRASDIARVPWRVIYKKSVVRVIPASELDPVPNAETKPVADLPPAKPNGNGHSIFEGHDGPKRRLAAFFARMKATIEPTQEDLDAYSLDIMSQGINPATRREAFDAAFANMVEGDKAARTAVMLEALMFSVEYHEGDIAAYVKAELVEKAPSPSEKLEAASNRTNARPIPDHAKSAPAEVAEMEGALEVFAEKLASEAAPETIAVGVSAIVEPPSADESTVLVQVIEAPAEEAPEEAVATELPPAETPKPKARAKRGAKPATEEVTAPVEELVAEPVPA